MGRGGIGNDRYNTCDIACGLVRIAIEWALASMVGKDTPQGEG